MGAGGGGRGGEEGGAGASKHGVWLASGPLDIGGPAVQAPDHVCMRTQPGTLPWQPGTTPLPQAPRAMSSTTSSCEGPRPPRWRKLAAAPSRPNERSSAASRSSAELTSAESISTSAGKCCFGRGDGLHRERPRAAVGLRWMRLVACPCRGAVGGRCGGGRRNGGAAPGGRERVGGARARSPASALQQASNAAATWRSAPRCLQSSVARMLPVWTARQG